MVLPDCQDQMGLLEHLVDQDSLDLLEVRVLMVRLDHPDSLDRWDLLAKLDQLVTRAASVSPGFQASLASRDLPVHKVRRAVPVLQETLGRRDLAGLMVCKENADLLDRPVPQVK